MSTNTPYPPFRPHPLVVGGHLQTIFGAWISGTQKSREISIRRHIELDDGDQLVLMDDFPASRWKDGDPVAVLLHGLGGSAESPHIRRIAQKLREQGVRTFRLNLRGCGAGEGLSKNLYHAGRSEDLQSAMEVISQLCPGSQVFLAGFSLGGNIVLKWLGEHSETADSLVDRAIAVNPPVDLGACTAAVQRRAFGFYDRYFAKMMFRQLCNSFDKSLIANAIDAPRRIICFDEAFTAPRSGFRSAAHYYDACSAAPYISRINVPTMILSAEDDPLIPVKILHDLTRPSAVELHIAESGGHLGYFGCTGDDPDRWWADWRVIDWFTRESSETRLKFAA
ncbi:putative hydrolase [Thalassoglobus neptunius]|uniref:Putative hydrolase n=1 Tax=Thalassoglobus neptunius TaxID=1938619 RepID=A0A5C5X7Z4_9PLAN|nr:alpha/beta fold hydrolase [Thalassoglobus neptunius]TWT58403.1 putative hydrolase [Thalassoglobus neptunius]